MKASDNGCIDTVRVLLEAKADPNITDKVNFHCSQTINIMISAIIIMIQDGETALHRAALRERVEVVKMLVDYRAAVDIRNKV